MKAFIVGFIVTVIVYSFFSYLGSNEDANGLVSLIIGVLAGVFVSMADKK